MAVTAAMAVAVALSMAMAIAVVAATSPAFMSPAAMAEEAAEMPSQESCIGCEGGAMIHGAAGACNRPVCQRRCGANNYGRCGDCRQPVMSQMYCHEKLPVLEWWNTQSSAGCFFTHERNRPENRGVARRFLCLSCLRLLVPHG
ncbi:hypothetical protein [Hephaestia mangrovi]|uniref:hypothetical protein n=1 Tax=Hephaestia mangrovi TaxID=2873268 RepID=UPI001CA6826A|nr:hypothetical protein [Hephaestia mangrovi]MBY8827214.1 hypothetical protein [Hephaestia mangrovi]